MYIRGVNISNTSLMHFFKLVFRSCLFVFFLVLYIYNRIHGLDYIYTIIDNNPYLLWSVATIFVVEMSLRFFPSSMESGGCQKQFAENYIPTGTKESPKIDKAGSTGMIIASWVLLNGIIFALYFAGIIDQGILLLVSLAYSVCDMVCILFFCPFQTWMMKNKCCGTCRIYNWDFIMMFTPCIIIDHPMAKILFAIALVLLIQWEYLYKKYPERFAENTNAYLQCVNCHEKLCAHKVQLQHYLVEFRKKLAEEKEKIEESI